MPRTWSTEPAGLSMGYVCAAEVTMPDSRLPFSSSWMGGAPVSILGPSTDANTT